jgi:adenine-specific DNA-methyltransferase
MKLVKLIPLQISSKESSANSSEDSNNKQITNDDYVYQTMLTCIGNKRKLVNNIYNIINNIKNTLKKDMLNIVDGFAGSSVVSRKLTEIADNLYTNDMELYSYLMAKCFLKTPTDEQKDRIILHINAMNQLAEKGPYIEGIVSQSYAPADTYNIKEGERCFYTRENALIIDTLRHYIETHVEIDIKDYCLAPLLNRASIHTNTAGVFKGFYKNGNVGCYGGAGKNALSRIMKPIRIDIPIWSDSKYISHCSNKDINTLIEELPSNIDVIYLDPPYNQHPYGSNYFMLNIIATNTLSSEISKVSGIPSNWNKSAYNSHKTAIESMKHLIYTGLMKSKYILLSYNNEGIITTDDWITLLEEYNVEKYEIVYDTYKGSRNLESRSKKIIEIMYLVSKN